MWRRPLVMRRARTSNGNTSLRPLVSTPHRSPRCIHSTRNRQTPNVQALIAEKLKQYVDPASAKPTRTYGDRIGRFAPGPGKGLRGRRRPVLHDEPPPPNNPPSGKGVPSPDTEPFLSLPQTKSKGSWKQQKDELSARPHSDQEPGTTLTSDGKSYSLHNAREESTTELPPSAPSSNRFASTTNPLASTEASRNAKKASQTSKATQSNIRSATLEHTTYNSSSDSGSINGAASTSLDKPLDTFDHASNTIRGNDSALKPLVHELEPSKEPKASIHDIEPQNSNQEAHVKTAEGVKEVTNPGKAVKEDDLPMKPLIEEFDTTAEPDSLERATEPVPAQIDSLKGQKTSAPKFLNTDEPLPTWTAVKRPGSVSRMIDMLSQTLEDRPPLYCALLNNDRPHVLLIYSLIHHQVFAIDLGKLGPQAFKIQGAQSSDVTLTRILRSRRLRMVFHDIRKPAVVLGHRYGINLDGVWDTQVMHAATRSKPSLYTLEESISEYLSETSQTQHAYRKVLEERDAALSEHPEKGDMASLKLPAVRNVWLHQLHVMPRLFDFYKATPGNWSQQCLVKTRQRVVRARLKPARRFDRSGEPYPMDKDEEWFGTQNSTSKGKEQGAQMHAKTLEHGGAP